MCQLLGMNCNVPTDIMFSFSGFSQRACEHADGFGIAFFEERGVRCFVDAQPANQSPVADLIKAYPIHSKHVVAHIRKATEGHVALENCHPFTRELWGRYWVFAHNGDLKNYHPRLHGAFRPVGDTDSERAFCWLLQEMAKSHASLPSAQELTRTLRELVPQVAQHGTFNFLLSNGEALWAHGTTKLHYLVRQYPFAQARLQDADITMDFAQIAQRDDRVALIATEPLTSNEPWTAFQSGELKVFAQGQLLDSD
ncbi:MAG TPA: class II glutamine amidotransferase [Aquabacterium sp.]|uniref:class II glutamine amidotransferase n=1 Tax=Aquabacterium sp. TaxID=1872578 RepID=UPI002E302CC2|nr:class II glutamine amidotransferase [Aquabacterium sp.]HEX5371245.1 class II glutamine amidotransferase [Aquabacterium sp.]